MKNYYLKNGLVEVPARVSISDLKDLSVIAQEKGFIDKNKTEWSELLGRLLRYWKDIEQCEAYYKVEFEDRIRDMRREHDLNISGKEIEVISSELAKIASDE